MRLAVLSDIHGNPIALDAVLGDIEERGGTDGYLVLGDLVSAGYDSAAVLRRLAALQNVRFVQGNADRYVLMGDVASVLANAGLLSTPTEAEAQVDPELFPAFVTVAQGLAWTHGYLAATGWLDWLAALPLEQRLTLPDGTRLLGVHTAPGRDDGQGVEPGLSDEELELLVAGCEADLVCVGDTHWPLDLRAGSVRVVNVGSVSIPRIDLSPDRRASYALLEASTTGYEITLHRVEYDYEAVVRAVQESHFFPNPEWLIGKFTGERTAP
jgi:predicted phosphodiesterase